MPPRLSSWEREREREREIGNIPLFGCSLWNQEWAWRRMNGAKRTREGWKEGRRVAAASMEPARPPRSSSHIQLINVSIKRVNINLSLVLFIATLINYTDTNKETWKIFILFEGTLLFWTRENNYSVYMVELNSRKINKFKDCFWDLKVPVDAGLERLKV